MQEAVTQLKIEKYIAAGGKSSPKILISPMLMENKNDALDLLSDMLIEIYENPKMQDAMKPISYFKTTLRNTYHEAND